MGALNPDPVMERGTKEDDEHEEEEIVKQRGGEKEVVTADANLTHHHISRPVPTPIQVTVDPAAAAAATFSAPQPPHPPPPAVTPSTTLNSRKYTNRVSLFLFLLHLLVSSAAVSFFIFKAIQLLAGGGSSSSSSFRNEKRALQFWLPPIGGSAVLSIILAFAWQRSVLAWPGRHVINFALWSTSGSTMSAGILLLCFAIPSASCLGVALILFSIGVSLYSCWVTRRVPFAAKTLEKSLQPAAKFRSLNGPASLVMLVGFFYITVWCFAVIGAQNFYYPPLTILGLVLSLMWVVEVMRNVVNLTVSRVISLYYLRGMQSSAQVCFQRAMSTNLGSAALGSLFVPTIEALRIMARGFNLLEEEDEFMFSCAHCCLRVMESVFHYGNSWAFVHIAAYGRGFVAASKSTWGLFERQKMEEMVDSDMTSSVCFLTGVCSGAVCVILAASWTFATHKHYTATVSLLAFFVGYLMTRIAMALPHACVACYYVCYAENPSNRLFDSTIPDQLNLMRTDSDVVAPTPRFPRRHLMT